MSGDYNSGQPPRHSRWRRAGSRVPEVASVAVEEGIKAARGASRCDVMETETARKKTVGMRSDPMWLQRSSGRVWRERQGMTGRH